MTPGDEPEGITGVALDRRRPETDENIAQKDDAEGHVHVGPRAQQPDPRPRAEEGDGETRPAGGGRSVSDPHRRAARPHRRHVPAAGLHAVRDLRFGHGLEPLAAVAREDHRSAVRVAARSHHHVQAGEEARFRPADVQEHQGQRRRAADRGHHARVQPRHVDDRLHRPEPGAPEAAHGEQAHLQHHHAEGRGRSLRRRLLRPAVAVLGHPGDEAPGHADPVRHQQARRRRRPELPRPFRRRARGREPAGRGLLQQGCRDPGRLSGVHRRHAEAARLVG